MSEGFVFDVVCPTCTGVGGFGEDDDYCWIEECPDCHGVGKLPRARKAHQNGGGRA